LQGKGKLIKVIITANADGAKIRFNGIRYKGEYGDINENYSVNDSGLLKKISLKKNERILTNEELSFVRAHGIKEELLKSKFINPEDIVTKVNVNPQLGGNFRDTSIEFIFIDNQ
jgi:hypothetical protein